jgi:hypothetical protein
VDSRTGEIIWRGRVDGQARGLAIAGGRLYVSTEQGTLYAFAPGHEVVSEPPRPAVSAPLPEGFALVVGSDDTAVGERLAAAGKRNVLVLLPDARAVREARARLVRQGVYGSSIVVHSAGGRSGCPTATTSPTKCWWWAAPSGFAPRRFTACCVLCRVGSS